MDKGSRKGLNSENIVLDKKKENEVNEYEERIRQKNMEIKQLRDNFKFQLQQEKYHTEELQTAISQVFLVGFFENLKPVKTFIDTKYVIIGIY